MHVFYVHSSITNKLAESIIRSDKLRDCVKISHGRYKAKKGDVECFEDPFNLPSFRFNVFKNWSAIRAGDKQITQQIRRPFHAYVPQTSLLSIQLLLSHPLCEGFSLLEEGLLSYCTKDQLDVIRPPKKQSLFRRLSNLNRINKVVEFYEHSYKKAYAITKSSFPDFERKEVVSLVAPEDNSAGEVQRDHCILILESLAYYENEIACTYAATLVEVLQTLRRHYSKMHYKLHPENYGTWQENLFKNLIGRYGPPAAEIDRGAVIEDVAVISGADVFVNVSSAGLYIGMITDGRVYSFSNIFRQNGAVTQSEEETAWIPDVFWDYVQPLHITPTSSGDGTIGTDLL